MIGGSRKAGRQSPGGEGRVRMSTGIGTLISVTAIGYWLLAWLTPTVLLAATHGTTDPNEIPALRPSKPELLPGFWEEHGVLVVVTGLVLLLLLVLLGRILTRPRPRPLPAPATIAREALQSVQARSEDAALCTEVSLLLRRYLIAAFELPREAFTSQELCQMLAGRPGMEPALSDAITVLLHDLEHQRFSAEPSPSELRAVPRALALIEQSEACLRPSPSEPAATAT